MATSWDRAAPSYLDEWVPRFGPYHLDLIRELVLNEGDKVLVPGCGPGADALAVARAVGATGHVKATDSSEEMIRLCGEQAKAAGLEKTIETKCQDAAVTDGGPWNAIVCAFGLWQLEDRDRALRAWSKALTSDGKVGVLTWGPPEPDEPSEILMQALRELEPEVGTARSRRKLAAREHMAGMFEAAGLVMIRHTIVRHTLNFPSGEAFFNALRNSCSWRGIWEELGDARIGRVAARFYDRVGGIDAPLSFEPTATIAIAARPGSEVRLSHWPSMRVPPMT